MMNAARHEMKRRELAALANSPGEVIFQRGDCTGITEHFDLKNYARNRQMLKNLSRQHLISLLCKAFDALEGKQ